MNVSDDTELLRAIRDAPFDDAPRLVYADWLAERGDPRGAFIAAQIRRSVEARDMWVELLREHDEHWAAHVRAIPNVRYRFERGFVEHVELDSFDQFLAHRARIVEWIPIPQIDVMNPEYGRVVISPERTFAALATTEIHDWGANGTDRHRVHDLATGEVLVAHEHRWFAPRERVARCWFPVGLRTLVIEYEDDRATTDLRF
jgi:uncharacterized protein (TIGR02996 family)